MAAGSRLDSLGQVERGGVVEWGGVQWRGGGVVVGGGLVNEMERALAQEPEDLGSSPGFAAVCLL